MSSHILTDLWPPVTNHHNIHSLIDGRTASWSSVKGQYELHQITSPSINVSLPFIQIRAGHDNSNDHVIKLQKKYVKLNTALWQCLIHMSKGIWSTDVSALRVLYTCYSNVNVDCPHSALEKKKLLFSCVLQFTYRPSSSLHSDLSYWWTKHQSPCYWLPPYLLFTESACVTSQTVQWHIDLKNEDKDSQ